MDQIVEIRFGDCRTAEKNHKGAIAMGVDVRRGISKPMNESGGLQHVNVEMAEYRSQD